MKETTRVADLSQLFFLGLHCVSFLFEISLVVSSFDSITILFQLQDLFSWISFNFFFNQFFKEISWIFPPFLLAFNRFKCWYACKYLIICHFHFPSISFPLSFNYYHHITSKNSLLLEIDIYLNRWFDLAYASFWIWGIFFYFFG